MNVTGYFNLNNRQALDGIDGSQLVIPEIIAGEVFRVFMRFIEVRDGVTIEVFPTVNAVKASLGVLDTRPTAGTFKLKVNTFNTSALNYNCTAAEIQTALEGLAEFAPGDVVVVEREDSFVITFPNDAATTQDIESVENRLHPVSFARVRAYDRGDIIEHELRLITAPVAYTGTYELENGPVPEISELRAGGSSDSVEWAEVQKLRVPASFGGTYRFVRNEIRSVPLGVRATAADIAAALEPLADEDGIFRVENPVDYVAYIYFEGEMIGIDQPLLTIEIFDGPPAGTVVVLDTNTREVADLLQGVDEQELILEVRVQIEDPDDADVFYWHTVIRELVTIRESVAWDELDTYPGVDWLRPPTFTSFNPFSPGAVSSGQIHNTSVIVHASTTVHSVNHGLSTNNVTVLCSENSNPGASLIEGTDFTWERQSTDEIEITFTVAPASPGVIVTVLGLAQTSFFDSHTHVISEVDGLQDWMDTVDARLSALEATSGGTVGLVETEEDGGESARWTFPTVWELYPSKTQPSKPESGRIVDIDLNAVTETGVKVIGKGKGLLPAVHDATVESLPDPVPAAGVSYEDKVYENDGAEEVQLFTGLGNKSKTLKVGDFAACDGRVWYPVTQYGQYEAHTFTADHTTETFTFVNLTEGEFLEAGTIVELTTTTTLPAGLSTGTDYEIFNPDFTAGTFQLVTPGGSTPITITNNGTGTHSVVVASEISYYPTHFERTLFTIHVNEHQLRAKKTLDVAIAFEVAVLNSNVEAQWHVMFEIGEARGVGTAGTEGSNLKEIVWRKIPALDQRIILTPSSTIHKVGLRITRKIINSVDTLTAYRLLYGALSGGVVPPLSANFALRAKLGRFDVVDDSVEDNQKGYVMLSGLNLETTSDDSTTSTTNVFEYGSAFIH